MNKTFALAALTATVALAATPGCRQENKDPLTAGEARMALEEASASSQASSIVSGSIEISTDFTIGGAVEQAAQEIRNYITSQLPCAEVTLEGNTLTIEYGVLPGNCTYRGHSYSGSHAITVQRNEENEIAVDHAWSELSNGEESVTGEAHVTWSFAEETRHVVHELTWTRLSDGRIGVGTGDRTQRPLPGGIFEGFQVDGERHWEGQAGDWDLDIDGVEMRWADPVPQSGTYTLTTPNDKVLSMSFLRIDEDTIEVKLENGKRTFSFNVNSIGGVVDNGMVETPDEEGPNS